MHFLYAFFDQYWDGHWLSAYHWNSTSFLQLRRIFFDGIYHPPLYHGQIGFRALERSEIKKSMKFISDFFHKLRRKNKVIQQRMISGENGVAITTPNKFAHADEKN